jgi:Meiotically up-regulated gene 113
MSTIRISHKTPSGILKAGLSYKAVGLYGLICSVEQSPSTYPIIYQWELLKYTGDESWDSVSSGLKELVSAGFIDGIWLKHSCVYLIEAKGMKRFKIGKTDRLFKQFKAIQSASPINVEIIHVILSNPESVGSLEKEFHSRFARVRIHGEWFDLSPEDVNTFVQHQGESES